MGDPGHQEHGTLSHHVEGDQPPMDWEQLHKEKLTSVVLGHWHLWLFVADGSQPVSGIFAFWREHILRIWQLYGMEM